MQVLLQGRLGFQDWQILEVVVVAGQIIRKPQAAQAALAS
jgi:hypothetical protein